MDANARCSAKSKQSGERCKRAAIVGGAVCHVHGGARRATREAARLRLLAAADPAAAKLVRLLDSDDEAAQHRAAVAVLDRAGLGRTDHVELSGPEGRPIAVTVQAAQVVQVLTGVLQDLDIELDDRVRQIVAGHLRTMSAHARAELSVVPDAR